MLVPRIKRGFGGFGGVASSALGGGPHGRQAQPDLSSLRSPALKPPGMASVGAWYATPLQGLSQAMAFLPWAGSC